MAHKDIKIMYSPIEIPKDAIFIKHHMKLSCVIVKLLEMCEPGQEHYTFEFYKCASCFVGDRGVFLRRCLRTLVARGYMELHRPHFNNQRWSITEEGKKYLSSYNPAHPTQL